LQTAGVLPAQALPQTDAELCDLLAEALAHRPQAEVLECLNAAGIPAAPVRTPLQLVLDPAMQACGLFAKHHLQDGTPYFAGARYAHFSRTAEQAVFEAPGLGEHSREVLAEAGLSTAEIDELIATGVVKQGQPFQVVAIMSYR
jgi:crotonobetainyl-CoA:carnitine CoA-transferase CaiB-like acyl-CoA transferase